MHSSVDPVISVFKTIQDARAEGRSIVFLLGAGISVGSGIPVVSGIKHYLSQVWGYVHLSGWSRPRDYLLAEGWPARHQLAVDLLERFRLEPPTDFTSPELSNLPSDIQYRVFLEKCSATLAIESIQHDIRRHHYPIAQLFDKQERKRKAIELANLQNFGFDYRAALACLCSDDKHLVDAFFDRLVRDREISGAHQFVALIAKELDSQLVLTTNFDNLVASALAGEGRRSIIYELLANSSSIPHEYLVRRGLSLVMLHGGTYSLSADFDLESELPVETLHKLCAYLPPDPLIIVLGYSGSDRRVMSFLRHFCVSGLCADEQQKPSIIWIHREPELPTPVRDANTYAVRVAKARGFSIVDPPPIQGTKYSDGRLFLQELYQRLVGGHAVSRSRYRALLHTPRRFSYARTQSRDVSEEHRKEAQGQLKDFREVATQCEIPRVTFLHAKGCKAGTSRSLTYFVESLEGAYETIWIDCTEIRSRATLIDTILESFRRHDRWLPPVVLPPFLLDMDSISPVTSKPNGYIDPSDATYVNAETEKAVQAITYALRRGRYVLAIDSLGEFANEHPSGTLPESNRLSRFSQVSTFLIKLAAAYRQFGESILALAYSRNWQDDQREAESWRMAEDALINGVQTLADASERRFCSFFVQEISTPEKPPAPFELYSIEEPLLNLAAAVACAFRRPRSFVAMKSIIADLVLYDAPSNSSDVAMQLELIIEQLGLQSWVDAVRSEIEMISRSGLRSGSARVTLETKIDELLNGFVSARAESATESRFLIHQEGGYYWMRESDRKACYQILQSKNDDFLARVKSNQESVWQVEGKKHRLVLEPLAALHEVIATYYLREAFEKSRDIHAFLEYIFHRIRSIGLRTCDLEPQRYASPKLLRLIWLIRSIERELERLQVHAPISLLLYHLYHIRRWLSEWIGFNKEKTKKTSSREIDQMNGQLKEQLERLDHCILEIWKGAGALGLAYEALTIGMGEQVTGDVTASTALVKSRLQGKLSINNPKAVAERTKYLRMVIERLHAQYGNSLIPIAMSKAADRDASGWQLLQTVIKAADQMRDELVPLGDTAAGRLMEEVRQVRVRARLKGIELILRRIDPWQTEWSPCDEDSSKWLGLREPARKDTAKLVGIDVIDSLHEKLVDWCRAADRLVRASQKSRRARRYRCYICTLRGRTETLAGNFDQAAVFFDRAKAALTRSLGPSDWTALGVTHLAESEKFLLEGRLCEKARTNNLNDSAKTTTYSNPRKYKAEVLYRRAETALRDARAALVLGKRDNHAWSLYYLLIAQMRYLQLCLKTEYNEEGRLRELRPDDAALEALHALRSATENLQMYDDRRKQVNILEGLIKKLANRIDEFSGAGPNSFQSLRIRSGMESPPLEEFGETVSLLGNSDKEKLARALDINAPVHENQQIDLGRVPNS